METGPGGLQHDPFHLFVYGNSPYRLSDRVWRVAVDVRANIERLLAEEIAQGTAAVDIATLLEQYLTPGARAMLTNTPYGVEGSYAARRLARTEITAAAGRAIQDAARMNPFVEKIRWNLSLSHPRVDICDDIVAAGEDGNGLYAIDALPGYPAHPHCLCYLVQVAIATAVEVGRAIGEAIQREQFVPGGEVQQLRGYF